MVFFANTPLSHTKHAPIPFTQLEGGILFILPERNMSMVLRSAHSEESSLLILPVRALTMKSDRI